MVGAEISMFIVLFTLFIMFNLFPVNQVAERRSSAGAEIVHSWSRDR